MAAKKAAPATELPKIGAPATRALTAAGLTTLDKLARTKEADIAALHGMGPKALGILKEALKAQGKRFAG
jgi:predicted flap endonuclease-1-like 5' DNA nuclease